MSFTFQNLRTGNKYRYVVFCLSLFLAVGCGQGSSDSENTDTNLSQLAERAEETSSNDDSPWEGRWELVLSNQTVDSHLLLLQIVERAGQRGIRMVDKAPMRELEKWKLTQAYFKEEDVLLAFETGNIDLKFEGTLHGEVVLGSVFSEGELSPSPARLVKTSKLNMQGVEVQQVAEGTKELEAAVKSPDPVKALTEYVKKNSDSPLIFMAYYNILVKALDKKAPSEQVLQITEDIKKAANRWGENLILKIYIEIIENTAEKPAYREIAVQNFNALKKLVGDEPVEAVKNIITEFQARINLADNDKTKQAAGEAAIKEILKNNSFYLKLVITLAEYYERQEKFEEALKIYSRLAALPGSAAAVRNIKDSDGEPVDVIEKTRSLWKGEDAQFEKYLDEVYKKEAFFFIEKKKPEMELRQGRRISLVELFTGAACPPCVAGDLALGGVEKMHPVPQFIAVRYHQHIPGPDPLTVSSGEARLSYYGGQGTPLLLINGRQVDNVGGLIFHAQDRYQQLYPRIKNLISQISIVKLELQTSLENGVVKIHAKADSISGIRKDTRLRILIVDPLIHYTARNGIRYHEMVVRDMPGGHEGVLASNGTAEVKLERSIPKLQSEIIDGLKSLEKNRGITFNYLPSELKQIQVIAFVQDDGSREILQSAISPVLTVVP